MAKLTTDTPRDTDPTAGHDTERELRARIAELEALLEARTQTIVGLGARVAELAGDAPPSLLERARSAEAALERLSATKVMRYSRVPRRVYTSVRRWWRG
jgi:hypothetical protein